MAEKKLTITKEQAEAFAKWQEEYHTKIYLVRATLRQGLDTKKCESCTLYTAMNNMLEEIKSLKITEGSADINGIKIESDVRFGFVLSSYMNSIREAFWNGNNTVEATLVEIILEVPSKQFNKIFFDL